MRATPTPSKLACQEKDQAGNVPTNSQLSLLRELPLNQATSLLLQMQRLEKRSFPSNEIMEYTKTFVLKPNTFVLLLFYEETENLHLIAYAVLVRRQRLMLLHKICVHSSCRNQGHGSRLMSDIIARAKKASCSTINLWVDEARTHARKLYSRFGFLETSVVENYYSIDRTGIKMSLEL